MKSIVSVCVLVFAFCCTRAQESTPSVTTTGEAIVYAAPDEIIMSLTIQTQDESIMEAKLKNREISGRAIKLLKESGVKAQHIQTQYLYITPVRRPHKNPEISHFSASQSISICITDLDSYEGIIDGLLETGVTTIGSPQFRNTQMRRHKDNARVKAIKAAKEKARLLANELGMEIGKPINIKEVPDTWSGRNQNAYANFVAEDVSAGSDVGQSFAPGQLEVRAVIEVVFELKEE